VAPFPLLAIKAIQILRKPIYQSIFELFLSVVVLYNKAISYLRVKQNHEVTMVQFVRMIQFSVFEVIGKSAAEIQVRQGEQRMQQHLAPIEKPSHWRKGMWKFPITS